MNLSGGRRIKRFVYIDLSSIKFCSSEMLERFKLIQLISKTIQDRQQVISDYNKLHNVDESTLVNGRRLTNIGVFRSYIEAYLQQHPMIHQKMTFIVRQLSPGEKGLPIEIYVFCSCHMFGTGALPPSCPRPSLSLSLFGCGPTARWAATAGRVPRAPVPRAPVEEFFLFL